ncbi:MAG: prepilin-type N-terminal cleavage/methylation domain-containing protein [Lachnospiraceae bacterium]|jgi:prepilin-type N-terminal cleavage/methylation domain-containing protein|nr:prepilin-type N-terminal cleavage/methylation domain-containing protein [Lachnospiraceae bacterium]
MSAKTPDINIGLNNKGFSLAEVMVAVFIASVVVGGVASLIFTSIRLFGTNNANAEIQNELQSAMSLATMTIMEAGGLAYVLPDNYDDPDNIGSTDIALLGDLEWRQAGGGYRLAFSGSAIIHGDTTDPDDPTYRKLYLVDLRGDEVIDLATAPYEQVGSSAFRYLTPGSAGKTEDNGDLALAQAADLEAALTDIRTTFLSLTEDEQQIWLMGRYVQDFRIMPAGELVGPSGGLADDGVLSLVEWVYVSEATENRYSFTEPFNLTVTINVRYSNNYERALVSDAALRSRTKSVFVGDPAGRGMQEYKRK